MFENIPNINFSYTEQFHSSTTAVQQIQKYYFWFGLLCFLYTAVTKKKKKKMGKME